MAAASNRYRQSVRRRNPGHRPHCQSHAEKMPRFQDAIPGDTQRAWQRRANPVLIDPLHLAPESTITSNMLKNSNVLLIPHAAAVTERNVTQRYLALWTPRLLSVGLIRCKRGWSHRLWTREERELAHLESVR